jgi:hypothetical protein
LFLKNQVSKNREEEREGQGRDKGDKGGTMEGKENLRMIEDGKGWAQMRDKGGGGREGHLGQINLFLNTSESIVLESLGLQKR